MYTFARHLRTSLARAYDSNVYYRAYALAGTCTLARIRPPVLVLLRMRPLAYAPAGTCMRDTMRMRPPTRVCGTLQCSTDCSVGAAAVTPPLSRAQMQRPCNEVLTHCDSL
jgi:hypothetical protein